MSLLPYISVVIPVRNGEKSLGNCLASLKQQNYPADRFEVIIADGLSTDGTLKIGQQYGAKVVINIKKTVAPGRNEGLKAARGELIAFSDDDCVMDGDWLSNSVKYFDDPQVAGLSGPTVTRNEGRPLGEAIGLIFDLAAGAGVSSHRGDREQVEAVDDIPGCNAIYRRAALERIFPINESLITAEDVEMNRLIRQLGFKLLHVPDVKLWHVRRQTLFGLFKQIYRFAVGRLQVGRKSLDRLKLSHVFIGFALPLLVLLLSANHFLGRAGIYYYVIFPGFLFIISFLYAYSKTISLRAALAFPLVCVIVVVAWSLGFMRELFNPIKT